MVIASRIFIPEPAAASFRLAALTAALVEQGADVTVLTTTAPPGEEDASVAGADVRRFPVLRDRQGYVRGYAHYMSFDVPLLFRLLFTRRPDVIVSEPPPTTGGVVRLVCAARRIPYVHYAADIWSDAAESTTAPGPVVGAVRAVERSVTNHAAAVLSVNAGVTARLESWGGPDNIVTVGNGVDTSTFTPSGPARSLDGPYMVYAGTASEIQGATVFVHAFAKVLHLHPTARLVFIGLGVDLNAIQAAAARLPDGHVMILGRASPSATAEWLRGAACSLASVRPGLGYDFMIPTKMYASLGCGTPVIFAGAGPSIELVSGNGLGWAVDHDVDPVAEAMSEALESAMTPERRQQLATWTRTNASLDAVAMHAGEVVREAARHAPSAT